MGHELLAAGVVGRIAVGDLAAEQEVERFSQAVDAIHGVLRRRRSSPDVSGDHVVDGAHGDAKPHKGVLRLRIAASTLGIKLGQSQVQEGYLAVTRSTRHPAEHQLAGESVAMHQLSVRRRGRSPR